MPLVTSTLFRAAALITLASLFAGSASVARAEIKDYEFRLVEKEARKGEAIISIRLVHKLDDRLVSNAVIFATRLDMAPEGMEEMKTRIEPAPSLEPGIYRFKADLTMEGKWRLSIAAKIQNETGSLENRLILKALP